MQSNQANLKNETKTWRKKKKKKTETKKLVRTDICCMVQ